MKHLGHFKHISTWGRDWDTYHQIGNIFIFNLVQRWIKILAASGPHIALGKGIWNSSRFFKIVHWSNFLEHFHRFIGHGIWNFIGHGIGIWNLSWWINLSLLTQGDQGFESRIEVNSRMNHSSWCEGKIPTYRSYLVIQ